MLTVAVVDCCSDCHLGQRLRARLDSTDKEDSLPTGVDAVSPPPPMNATVDKLRGTCARLSAEKQDLLDRLHALVCQRCARRTRLVRMPVCVERLFFMCRLSRLSFFVSASAGGCEPVVPLSLLRL